MHNGITDLLLPPWQMDGLVMTGTSTANHTLNPNPHLPSPSQEYVMTSKTLSPGVIIGSDEALDSAYDVTRSAM